MSRPQSTAEDARNAMVAGLLASGISVNGLQPSHNPQVASQMFTTATTLDPEMCDAWLARVLAGDQSIEVLSGAWASIRTFGWDTRRLGVTELQFRPEVSDGLFLRLAVTSVESLACAYAAVLAEAKRYEEAAKLLDGVEPRQPFDEELINYVRGILYFRTGRWPDVLTQFPEGKTWRNPELKAAGAAMATTALASLGVFEEAVRRGQDAIEADRVPGAANVAFYTQGMCLRHLGREEEAVELLRRVYSRDPKFTPAREALDNPNYQLILTDPETIEARTDPWDPDSAPTREETEAARHAEEAAKYLAEGRRRAQRDAGHGKSQTGNQTHQVDDQGELGPRQDGPSGAGDVPPHLVAGAARDRQDVGSASFHQAAVRTDRAAQAAGGGDQPHQAAGPVHGRRGEERRGDARGRTGRGGLLRRDAHPAREAATTKATPTETRSSTRCCCTWRIIATSSSSSVRVTPRRWIRCSR